MSRSMLATPARSSATRAAAIAILLLLLAACGGDQAASPPDETAPPATEDPGEQPEPGATPDEATPDEEIEEVVLRAVTAWPLTQTSHVRPFLHFTEKLEEITGGRMTVDIIGGPETMDETEITENLRLGSIDLALTSPGYYAEAIPEVLLFQYTTQTPEEWWENGNYDLVNEWHEERLNQHVIGRLGEGQAYALYTVDPVDSVEDFRGMRLRGGELYKGFMDELGVEMVSMPPGDIYTAIERGTVQGTAWPDLGVTNMSLEEVINYVIYPRYYKSGITLNINLDAWNDLSPAAQDALMEAVRSAEEISPELMQEERDAEFEILSQAGVEIIELEGADAEAYLQAAQDGLAQQFTDRGIDPAVAEDLMERFR